MSPDFKIIIVKYKVFVFESKILYLLKETVINWLFNKLIKIAAVNWFVYFIQMRVNKLISTANKGKF